MTRIEVVVGPLQVLGQIDGYIYVAPLEIGGYPSMYRGLFIATGAGVSPSTSSKYCKLSHFRIIPAGSSAFHVLDIFPADLPGPAIAILCGGFSVEDDRYWAD